MFAMLGQGGVLGLAYPEECGQPHEVCLQVLDKIAVLSSCGVSVNAHALSCFGLF